MPNPFENLIDNDVIDNKLIEEFENVISRISACPEHLLKDCAKICAFLQSRDIFEKHYIQVVDKALQKEYEIEKVKSKEFTYSSPASAFWGDGGALMRSFYNLMKNHGFNVLEGIVFTGDAGGFYDVVKNGILFKDMTGPMHGEYSHPLQWLSICLLLERRGNDFFKPTLILNNNISQIYKTIISIEIIRPTNNELLPHQHNPDKTWPGEISFTTGARLHDKPKSLWDFMVDCFASENPITSKTLAEEDPLENIYTNSYRCPAYITLSLQFGKLRNTFMGEYWDNRTKKYKERMNTEKWFHLNKYRKMAINSQLEKRKPFAENSWKASHKLYNRIQKRPAWSLPDLDSPPDIWDDDPIN